MLKQDSSAGREPLQFDRVVAATPAAAGAADGVTCAACRAGIDTEYFDVNGHVLCARCRAAFEAAAETPRGITPFALAALFGLAAGIAGAIIYYAVIAIAHIEIGIMSILIGYMVGYSVRRGARGRGGLRFQVLALALTYMSIGLAYTPLALRAAAQRRVPQAGRPAGSHAEGAAAAGQSALPGERTTGTARAATDQRPARGRETARGGADDASRLSTVDASSPAAARRTTVGGLFGVLVAVVMLSVSMPVLIVVGGFPTSLISAAIIFFGMSQAWRVTAAPFVQVLGPYAVAPPATASPTT